MYTPGENMKYEAKHIANFFVKKGMDSGNPVTPMKLQKLVYIAHGWHLGLTGEPLFKDEVGAWPFGPVIRSVYKEFISFSKSPITELAVDFWGNVCEVAETDEHIMALLEKIWEVYGKYSATQLSNMTHERGTPWDTVYEEGKSKIIPNQVIEDYYKEMAG